MSSPAASKDKLFPGISATETKLLVLANVCLKNDRIDYDKLALNAGIKASSAQTLFRNAKRKLDKLFGDDDANVDGNGAQADLTPVETPSKRGKSNAKAKLRTPKTPKPPKNPKTSQAPKTPKGSKGAVKFAESGAQDTVDPKLSTITKPADIFAKDTTRETAIADPSTDTLAASGATDKAPKVTAEDKEENEIANNSDKPNEDALNLAVNQQLPESPSPKEEDDAPYEDVQENEEEDD
ncbi:uncharacterized protein N7500_003180 [Penicillium coprophilum]|uniref:uncharacterized protein n=1 Tax=Penicillium coprophilum TaxID=36646 RepID=UPI00238435D3|nr:uncharacterized protein N7500_003180 [Penicillium coprophilum]KAJ5170397.1 hypothetical protein N7500_003180 [Penicillium coprophilum]